MFAGLRQCKQIDADALGQRVVDLAGNHDNARVEIMLVNNAGGFGGAGRFVVVFGVAGGGCHGGLAGLGYGFGQI